MMRVKVIMWILFFAVGGWANSFVHGPYTGDPREDAVTVSWTMEPPSVGAVEYAPSAYFAETGDFSERVRYLPEKSEGRETAHVRLEGLLPATEYVYRVILEGGEASPLGTFYTAPPRGRPAAFAVISDTQWRDWTEPNRIELVGDALAADPTPFQFILHAGDIVERPFRKYWDHLFASLGDALLRAPFIPVLGNHERGHISYYEYFDLPPGGGKFGERWWALYWGDIVVVGLDSNVRVPSVYQEQIQWLREHLATDRPHKFVVFHHPAFSSDSHYGPGSPGIQALWHPIFVEYGVDIVFNGHAHNYERIVRDGVTYLVVGGGGAPLYPQREPRIAGSVVGYDDFYFYVRVRTSPEGIAVEAVRVAQLVDGEISPAEGILDSFFLPTE